MSHDERGVPFRLARTIRRHWPHLGDVEVEYLFAPDVDGKPLRRWRMDVAIPSRRQAVEIDGGMFRGGRHGGAPSAVRDLEKRQAAACMGWRVLTLTPGQAEDAIRCEGPGHDWLAAFILGPGIHAMPI